MFCFVLHLSHWKDNSICLTFLVSLDICEHKGLRAVILIGIKSLNIHKLKTKTVPDCGKDLFKSLRLDHSLSSPNLLPFHHPSLGITEFYKRFFNVVFLGDEPRSRTCYS